MAANTSGLAADVAGTDDGEVSGLLIEEMMLPLWCSCGTSDDWVTAVESTVPVTSHCQKYIS